MYKIINILNIPRSNLTDIALEGKRQTLLTVNNRIKKNGKEFKIVDIPSIRKLPGSSSNTFALIVNSSEIGKELQINDEVNII